MFIFSLKYELHILIVYDMSHKTLWTILNENTYETILHKGSINCSTSKNIEYYCFICQALQG